MIPTTEPDPQREFLFPVGSLLVTRPGRGTRGGSRPDEPDYARVEAHNERPDLRHHTYLLAPCGADGVVSWNPFRQECGVEVIHEQCEVADPKPIDPRDYLATVLAAPAAVVAGVLYLR